jgi:hypothetical protein
MAAVVHNNKISEPEEGEVIDDDNESSTASANANKQVEPQNEALTDTKTKIDELKAAVEDPLRNIEEQKLAVNIERNNAEELKTPELNNEIKQDMNTEQIETT